MRKIPSIKTQAPKNSTSVAAAITGCVNAITPKIIAATPRKTGTHQWRFKVWRSMPPVLETRLSKGKRIPLLYLLRAYRKCCAERRTSSRPLQSALHPSLCNAGAASEKRGQIGVNQRRASDSLQIARRFKTREKCVRDLASRHALLAIARGNITRPVSNVLTIRPIFHSQKDRGVSVLVSSHRTRPENFHEVTRLGLIDI